MGEVTSIKMAKRRVVNGRAEPQMEQPFGDALLKLIET
jgi:hypothetical protein